MKKNTKMFQRSLTAFLTAALVTTSFGGQGIVFAKAKKKASHSVSLTVTNPAISMPAVSYTHLDVYKRQVSRCRIRRGK